MPGTGKTRVNTRPRRRSSIGSGGFHPTCMAYFHWVNVPEAIRSCLGIVDDHQAVNRERQRVATEATAALAATDHRTAYPGNGASKI